MDPSRHRPRDHRARLPRTRGDRPAPNPNPLARGFRLFRARLPAAGRQAAGRLFLAMSPVRPTSTSSPRLPPDSAVGGPVREVLSLDQLVTDAGTQVRSAIDDEVVDEYVQALADGAQFPPVVVFRADGAEMLADGYHRVFAYRKAGRSEIPADVYHGTREDALWFALGANRAHGQRLSGADKRRAIELAYRAWPDLSQVRIAAQVGCAQPYVGEVRAQLKATFKLPDRVVGVDGRLRAATRPASSSRRKPSPCSDAAADSPAPIAGDGGSRLDVDSLPSAGRPVASAVGDPSLVPSSELPVSQPPVPDDDRSEPSSSSGSSPAPSGNGLTASQSARDRSNRIVSVVAYDAKNLTAQDDLIEFAALDRAQLPDWIADLEEARRGLVRFIRRLRQEVADGSSSTPVED